MENLKKFKNKGDLMPTWEGDHPTTYGVRKNHALHAIYNCREFLRYKDGKIIEPTIAPEAIEDKMQTVYTDTSAYAALWLPSVELVAAYGDPLTLRGVALSKNWDAVLIFNDYNGNEYYFYGWEFWQYQKDCRRKQRAAMYAEFVKNSNKAQQKIVEVLKEYAGKPYGAKTAEKIRDNINSAIECYGVSAYYNAYHRGMNISAKRADLIGERTIYAKITDDNNRITTEALEKVTTREECDPVEEWNKTRELVEKIKTNARELVAMVHEYRRRAALINIAPAKIHDAELAIDSELVRGEL